MKKLFIILALSLLIPSLISCDKEKQDDTSGATKAAYYSPTK